MSIKECHEEKWYSIEAAYRLLHVARFDYHKWASGKLSYRAAENERLADKIKKTCGKTREGIPEAQ